MANEKEEALEIESAIKKLIGIQNDQILTLIGYDKQLKSKFCSSFYQITVYFEYPDNLLPREISYRNDNNLSFSSLDLLKVLYLVVDVH